MISGKAFGHSRKLLALQFARNLAQGFIAQDCFQFLMALLQKSAIRQQLVALRSIYAAEDQQLGCREVEIKYRAFSFDRVLSGENGGDVGFVGSLDDGKPR